MPFFFALGLSSYLAVVVLALACCVACVLVWEILRAAWRSWRGE